MLGKLTAFTKAATYYRRTLFRGNNPNILPAKGSLLLDSKIYSIFDVSNA